MVDPVALAAARLHGFAARYAPGLLLSAVLAMAAAFISNHYGGPVMLLALLLGMAFNFLAAEQRFAAGVGAASRTVLRLGVALLGLRITFSDIQELGGMPILLVTLGLVVTMACGMLLARRLGLSRQFATLTAGAVAICGASAAMAIAAVLPRYPSLERDTVFTVIAVTTLSTIAMVLYPIVASALELDPVQAGMFLGGTIHDVAQVVGAGYMVSDETGDVATFTKLLRVSLLIPLIGCLLLSGRSAGEPGRTGPRILPGFLVAFAVLVVINSLGLVPEALRTVLVDGSRACLVVAIAGLGVRSSLQEIAAVGGAAVTLVIAETLVLAGLVLLVLLY